jgi:hypothetical protein
MPTLLQRLQLLSAGPADATAAVLLLALPRASSDEIAPICLTLAATGAPGAVLGAVSNASKLHDGAQHELAQAIVLSESCLRAIVTAGVDATTSLVALLARRDRVDAPLLLARLVSIAPWQEARTNAAEAMLASLARLLGPAVNATSLSANLARRLDETLAEAVDRYPEHRCDAVLHALALLACGPGPRLNTILEDAGHPAMFALRHAVGRADRPELRRQLLRMLTAPALATVIQRNLHRTTGSRAHEDLLAGAHLLRAPARKRAMRAVDRPLRCVPTMTEALELSDDGQANLPLLIESLGLPTSKRLEHLADLIALESTLGRLRAVTALSRYEAEDARAALRPLTLDRSPWVARIAAHATLARAQRDNRSNTVAAGLLASPHPQVARRARWLLISSSALVFFEHWLELDQTELFAAAMAVAARERKAFVDKLSAGLNGGPRAARLIALTLATRLDLIGEVEQDVIVLAASSDPHVASAAVAALGYHESPRSSEAARVALRHVDARVRANAVESLARHDNAGALATMAALSEHRHNRLRANSVLALLRGNQPVGAQALRAMLADSDPMHRVSGIWVAGRAHALFARSDLRTLAERDGRIEIRKRAARTLRRIDHAARPLELTEALIA